MSAIIYEVRSPIYLEFGGACNSQQRTNLHAVHPLSVMFRKASKMDVLRRITNSRKACLSLGIPCMVCDAYRYKSD